MSSISSYSNYASFQRCNSALIQLQRNAQTTGLQRLSFLNTNSLTINSPSYYIIFKKNNICFLNPTFALLNITLNITSSSYVLIQNIPFSPSRSDYNPTVWTNLTNNLISVQVYLTVDTQGNLILNIPSSIPLGIYNLNLMSIVFNIE